MSELVLLRHGQSAWNLANRFTGWWDIDLSPAGEQEARAAGRAMLAAGLDFDLCFTSVLRRAIRTLHLALDEMDRLWLPEEKDWRLNERHYGALTGLDKAETTAVHGEEQVRAWRRSYDVPPPPEEQGSPWAVAADRRYAGLALPEAESLKDTVARMVPVWDERIAPTLAGGRRVLVVAHGNSLRALVKHLSRLSDDEIMGVEVPTGRPIVYDLGPGLEVRGRRFLDV